MSSSNPINRNHGKIQSGQKWFETQVRSSNLYDVVYLSKHDGR